MTTQEFIDRVNAEKHDQVKFSANLSSLFPGSVMVSASMGDCHYDMAFNPEMFDARFDFWEFEKDRIVRAIVGQVEKVKLQNAIKHRNRN
jgi:hypothetical protein